MFDQPYIKFTDKTLYKNYLYTRTVEDDNKDFRLGDNFTIEFWVRNIATPTNGWCYFIAYHPDNATGSGWAISYRNTDKKIQFHNSNLPTGEPMPVTNTLISSMTDWTHVAFVKNKKTMAVYVNGVRENIYNNVSNTYNIDTNIKDGLYIGRQNSTWNTADERFVGDFGGLKISKYARYDVTQTNIDILDFSLDNPTIIYENIIKRHDKFNIYNEAYDGISNYGYKGMLWKNYKDGYDILNVNNPNFYTYNYYKYDTNDRSNIMSINGSPCGYVMFNQFGSIINNVDQDYTIFWDFYFDERWCDLTKTPKCQFLNFCWEQSQSTQIRLFYGRDTASGNRSFAVFLTSGAVPTSEAGVTEANRIYFDFKFEPNVKYKFSISQKNHKRYYYINGNLFASRDISELFMVYGANLYGNSSNTELSTTAYNTEYELCEKIDNIFIKVGDAFSSDFYDYNNDEYDYDFNKNLDENKFADYSNVKFKTIESESLTWNKTPVVNYTNTITSSNIDSTTFAIEDINDVRKIDEFTVYIEGKRNNKNEAIDILGKNNVFERLIKSPNVISKVKAFNNNKIKFINNDELIVQDKNINVVLGYLTGELEQTECKTNGYYIKVFNHNTNRFIGEYEIIDGIFKIDNLNYYEYYDVVLCDRLNKIENQVMSKRKPTLYNNDDILTKVYSNNDIGESLNTELFVDISIHKTNYDFTTMNALSEAFSLSRNSTATYFNEIGDLADAVIDQPRFDYVYQNGKLKCKGLLVEVASKNLYSGNVTETNYTTNVKSTNIYNTDSYNISTTSSGNYECFLAFLSGVSWTNRNMSISVLADTTSHAHLGLRPIIIRADNGQITSLCTWELIDGTVTPVTQPSEVNKSFEFVNNKYARFSVGLTDNNSTPNIAYFRVNPTLNHNNTIDNTHSTLLKIGLPQAEMLPYSTSYIRGVNTLRSADILSFNINEITGTVAYVYYNQINPTERKIDFVSYVNSKPDAKPSGFISGWIEKIVVYEKLLNDAEITSELNKI